jgi:hypothetical protein
MGDEPFRPGALIGIDEDAMKHLVGGPVVAPGGPFAPLAFDQPRLARARREEIVLARARRTGAAVDTEVGASKQARDELFEITPALLRMI